MWQTRFLCEYGDMFFVSKLNRDKEPLTKNKQIF